MTTDTDNERRRRIEADIRLEPFTDAADTPPTTIEAAMAYHRVPGCAVAVIAGGEVAWARGYGTIGRGDATPVGTDSIFQACSISKPVAAVAALRLVREGRLDLDEDVNAYLRSWRVPANGGWQPRVTLRQLLSHTAGLTSCWYPGYPRDATLPTLVETLGGLPPANTPAVRATMIPGTQFRYSGSHYSVLQQVLADVTGRPLAALARDLVFAPLGMVHSGYETDFPERHVGATTIGHDAGGRRIAGDWYVLPESAGAGLWTTPSDLCRLAVEVCRAWSGDSDALLDWALARQMFTPQIGGWGLGWSLQTLGPTIQFAHGGSNTGYKCRLVAWPEYGLGAVVMTNADEGSALIGEIVAAIAREYAWPDAPARDAAPDAGADESLPAYAGTYGDGAGVSLTVTGAGDGLRLVAPGQPALALRTIGWHRYRADSLDAEIAFEVGTSIKERSGEVVGMTLRQRGLELRLARVV